jgi:Pilin accessory protein (PilO)
MSAHIIELRKRQYVCGLFWQSLSRPRELRAEAKELAQTLNLDLMVVRKELGVAQAGYASSREGARKGLLSLGAMVASNVAVKGVVHDGRQQPASNWLCALKLSDEIWVYFAVRDDNFLPNGDFAGSRSEVLERLVGDYAMGGWNAVIADAELQDQGFHNFNAASVDDFLPPVSRGRLWLASAWELRQVNPGTRWPLVFAIGGGVTCLAFGFGYQEWQRRSDANRAMQDQMAQAERMRIAAQKARIVQQPWESKPSPREFTRNCQHAMTQLFPGGWTLDEFSCTADRASYVWSRGSSTVAYLLEQLPGAQIDLSGDKATFTQTFTFKSGNAESLLDANAVLWPLLSRFQELGLKLKVSAPLASPATLPGIARAPAPKSSWIAYPISLHSGGLAPAALASALTQPGVRVDREIYRQGEWAMEGVIYAK